MTGLIPAEILAGFIQPVVRVEGTAVFAARCGLSESHIRKVCAGTLKTCHIATADKIITRGMQRPDLWGDVRLVQVLNAHTEKRRRWWREGNRRYKARRRAVRCLLR